jgi:hypothetical protein
MTASGFRSAGAVLLAVLGAATCDTPGITVAGPGSDRYAGYDPASITGFIYHWPAGHNIAIYVDRTDEPADADLGNAVHAAIAAWEPVARLGEVRMHVVTDVHDAEVIFRHSHAPTLVGSAQCDQFGIGAGGVTFFCVPDATPLVPVRLDLLDGSPGHVMMEVAVNRFVLDTASFFPSLVAHEMGHVLGIGAHSPNTADLMYGRPRLFQPTDADAATLRYVLSQRPDVRF